MASGNDGVVMPMQSFFTMWWPEQSEHTQKLVNQLVKNKQLGFVNGGQVAPLASLLARSDDENDAEPCHAYPHILASARFSSCCALIWHETRCMHLKGLNAAVTLSVKPSEDTYGAQPSRSSRMCTPAQSHICAFQHLRNASVTKSGTELKGRLFRTQVCPARRGCGALCGNDRSDDGGAPVPGPDLWLQPTHRLAGGPIWALLHSGFSHDWSAGL